MTVSDSPTRQTAADKNATVASVQQLRDRVRNYINATLPRIERKPAGRILFPWLSVTYGEHYASTIYTWDFHHAAMRFAIGGQPEYLRFLVDNLLAYQQPDGHTPHVVNQHRGPRFLDIPSHAQPFLMQAAFMYVKQTGDTAWGIGVFDALAKYMHFFNTTYTTVYGLKRWRTNWMGGLDNDVVTAFMPPDTIVSCDINGWLYIEMLAGQKLARLLGRADGADHFASQAQKHRRTVNDTLWSDALHSYSAYNLCDGKHFFSLSTQGVPDNFGCYAFQSCSNLMPLYARMADEASARAMIETYLIHADHFWSPFGVRSLSKSSEYFNNAVLGNPSRFGDHRRMNESNWQGPVWMPINYFAFHALRHYGYTTEARQLADRVLRLLANSLDVRQSFAENFNSETGQPLYAERYTSWNMLVDTLHDDLTDAWIMDAIFADDD